MDNNWTVEEMREEVAGVLEEVQAEQAAIARFRAAFPDGCVHCFGIGFVQDGRDGWEYCSECLEKGKCPKCGQAVTWGESGWGCAHCEYDENTEGL